MNYIYQNLIIKGTVCSENNSWNLSNNFQIIFWFLKIVWSDMPLSGFQCDKINCIKETYPLILQASSLCCTRGHPGALPPVLYGIYILWMLHIMAGLRKTLVTTDNASKDTVCFVIYYIAPKKLNFLGTTGGHSIHIWLCHLSP